MEYNLLQKHTVEIYQLESHKCIIQKVSACTLLKPQRFDLFAKLYYIRNASTNRDLALKVYVEHIKAFNPDGCEPGREDKHGVWDFVSVFDELIAQFKDNDFDDSISIIPVDKNGVILDGAHRVAALAYYNKDVTVAYFADVEAKCDFDYCFFKNRGLSWEIADIIALEMVEWVNQLLVACIWPITGAQQKSQALCSLAQNHYIVYRKDIRCNLHSLSRFVRYIYRDQSWTNNSESVLDKASRVYGKSSLSIVFFIAETSLDSIVREKDIIRQLLGRGKDSLHIADSHKETLDIANLVLDNNCLNKWMNNLALSSINRICNSVKDSWLFFRKIQWISFKVRVFNMFKLIRS